MLCWRKAAVADLILLATVSGILCSPTEYCDAVPDAPDPPPYPDVALRYSAEMEVVNNAPSIPGASYTKTEMYVREVYDEPGNRLSMEIRSREDVKRYIMDWNIHQVLEVIYSKHGNSHRECQASSLSDGEIFFPPIWGSGQNVSFSHIIGPGVLLGIMNWTEAQYKGKYTVRGMTADRWDWCGLTTLEDIMETHNVSMATYWSDRSWQMAVPRGEQVSLPLSWEVEIRKPAGSGLPITDIEETLVHNAMSFMPNFVDESAFLVPSDVYCDGYVPDGKNPFPDFAMDRLFTFSMEMKETNVKVFTWADSWYDFEKQLYRTDHDLNFNSSDPVPTTHIFDFVEGIAYSFPMESGGYVISIINDTKADWVDITGIDHLWADSPNAFFGTQFTNYSYYGPWFERYIKGEEWRGLRTDWPSNGGTLNDKEDITPQTLWQWTFANKNVSVTTSLGEHLYVERNVPIGLRVTALNDINMGEINLPKGHSFSYQIYDFDLETGARATDVYSDGGVFDVSRCYSANFRKHLRFKLDVSSWPEVVDTPLLTSGFFNEHWQKELAFYGQVSLIRITRVKTITEEAGEIWVEFVLLDRHPEIGMLSPSIFESMTTGEAARRLIEKAIDEGNVKFEGENYDGTPFALVAAAGSLSFVIEPICTTTTPGPTISVSGTSSTSTTKSASQTGSSSIKPTQTGTPGGTTTSVEISSSTPDFNTTDNPVMPPEGKRYSGGALAGLGIGMLVTGLAAGATATYFVVNIRG